MRNEQSSIIENATGSNVSLNEDIGAGGDGVINEAEKAKTVDDGSLKVISVDEVVVGGIGAQTELRDDGNLNDSESNLVISEKEIESNKENVQHMDHTVSDVIFRGVRENQASNDELKSGYNKSVLHKLYGVTSSLDNDVSMTSQLVTNRGELTFHNTPPRPAPIASSCRLQSLDLPLTVARRVPGMVRLTQSMEADDMKDAAAESGKANQDINENKNKEMEGAGGGKTDESDLNENTTKDRSDDHEEKTEKEKNSPLNSLEVITKQSKFTVDMNSSKNESKAEASEADQKCKDRSERTTQIPEELKVMC